MSAPARPFLPRVQNSTRPLVNGWNRTGEQVQFFVKTIVGTKDVWIYYRVELLRQIAQMSLGVGAMALIGGTIVVVAFLSSQVGSLVAIQVYGSLANVGIEALTGFASAYVNTRLAGPVIVGIAMAATIGAGATAQLGAMRINEEIDALEVIGVRSIPYLCSTRLVAGVALSIPLYCLGMLAAWTATKLGTILSYGQSTGVYDHYFNTFLNPMDVILSFVQAIGMATIVMLIHTYYGYTASGGPAGVGAAVGRGVRASLVAVIFVLLFVAMGIYGQAGGLNISG
ncbi:ABC transporter permease [Mycolicibacterium flavescens]|uniref:ABC transporter permease n=1 Tax=Mycolicibacterium flavescens TaxID=1776 RepID=A0A1E3RDP5_MYCFV|nr:ABC transporter permease [Mycolicibacterium flavescens]MCV7282440.1 ABC transporter permease [Mycolicibacterium flavescens]ODQ87954.1 ABC transporter permease [Mycolicibacterium flavescens]